MFPTSLIVLSSVVVVSIISLTGVVTLSIKERTLCRWLFFLVSLSAGALLGDAFIHLIPEAFEGSGDPLAVSLFTITGFLFFFVVEKFLHWHHVHGETEIVSGESPVGENGFDAQTGAVHPTGYMILVSDGFHNFLDGLIIGASYLAGTGVGVATTIAIILHEVPQEIGDFGVLLHAGLSRSRALFLNLLSALLAVVGASAALLMGALGEMLIGAMVPLAAGGFIYIAASDLVPELHKTKEVSRSLLQLAGLLAGIMAMILLLFLEV